MSKAMVLLWVIGGVTALALTLFTAIFVRFIAKALVRYLKHKPVGAMTVFVVAAAPTAFFTSYLGVRPFPAILVGLSVGMVLLMLVAVELGSD